MTYKIKAGALQLTLFVAVVIALLLGAFLLFVHLQNLIEKKNNLLEETVILSQKGIERAYYNSIFKDSLLLEVNDDKNVIIKRTFWGVFPQVHSKSNVKNLKFEKRALIGKQKNEKHNIALYLQDNNRPLVLVGNTKIKGNVKLPKLGVKSGYISGIAFYGGNNLIDGNSSVAYNLPELNKELVNNLKKIFNLPKPESNFINIDKNRVVKNSFFKETNYLFSSTPIELSNIELAGNVKVISQSKIIVHSSAKLSDIIIIAPEIEIKSGFKGKLQAIASNKIAIKNNVELSYPSSVVIYKQQKDLDNLSSVIIEENTEINGSVIYLDKEKELSNIPAVSIKENVKIRGEVYSNSTIELLGKVYGTIYTSNFITRQSGSVYLNHIYNGEINIDSLSSGYSGVLFKDGANSVVKWLY